MDGTLDYRDYSNDTRVTLPTIMQSDGSSGPSMTVWQDRAVAKHAGRLLRSGLGYTSGKNLTNGESPKRAYPPTVTADNRALDGMSEDNGRKARLQKTLICDGNRIRINDALGGRTVLMRQSRGIGGSDVIW
jgi:hypothetical protein